VNVLEVIADADRQRRVGPGTDLPEPGEARPHSQPLEMDRILERYLAEFVRARADQAHLAANHVPELGKLVQAEAAE